MSGPEASQEALRRLHRWLLEEAYPIWWKAGADLEEGGFHDRLSLRGVPEAAPKRLRVQARQAYAYALAPALGWEGPAEAACRHGLAFIDAGPAHPDGLYRLTGTARPKGWDGMGELYDQSFVLLALATAKAAFGDRAEESAQRLRDRLAAFAHPLGGYAEAPGLAEPLFANPNMHLFEAFQAWAAASDDPSWAGLADAQGALALSRLIDPATGALAESYGRDWRRADAPTVWPGHLFEWGWLLLRWRPDDPAARKAALGLIDVAETHGVDRDRNVAIFALDGALKPTDRTARLWAQTERLKAAVLAAHLTGEDARWKTAAEACIGLEGFLACPGRGLWRDRMLEDGGFVEEAAPASSFYHIVCAIAELSRLLGR